MITVRWSCFAGLGHRYKDLGYASRVLQSCPAATCVMYVLLLLPSEWVRLQGGSPRVQPLLSVSSPQESKSGWVLHTNTGNHHRSLLLSILFLIFSNIFFAVGRKKSFSSTSHAIRMKFGCAYSCLNYPTCLRIRRQMCNVWLSCKSTFAEKHWFP